MVKSKCDLKLYMTTTELTESIEIGVGDGKGISVISMTESYKK